MYICVFIVYVCTYINFILYVGLSANNIEAGIDYSAGPYTVTFPVGSTNASFDILINTDNILEEIESFSLTITSVTNGYVLNDFRIAFVSIVDTTGMITRQVIT